MQRRKQKKILGPLGFSCTNIAKSYLKLSLKYCRITCTQMPRHRREFFQHSQEHRESSGWVCLKFVSKFSEGDIVFQRQVRAKKIQ